MIVKNIILIFAFSCLSATFAAAQTENKTADRLQFAKIVNDELYISAKFSSNQDIVIHFKKCMFNNIMTFYTVGLVKNNLPTPITNFEQPFDKILNKAYSDNVGPVLIQDVSWVGANHSYKEKNKTRTAKCVSFEFVANGKKLCNGDKLYCPYVEVNVKNILYNPNFSITTANGNDSLYVKMIEEQVRYRIENGNILVSVKHTYFNDEPVKVSHYYGMQSMCEFEKTIFTPNGKYSDFTIEAEVENFNKKDYPNFNKFIERSADGKIYQSSYLLPYEIGNHSQIGDNDAIFIRSWKKCYHQIVCGKEKKRGDTYSWCGLYSWTTAFCDNEKMLAYCGRIEGRDIMFIDCKKAVDEYIEFPATFADKSFVVLNCDDTINVEPYLKGLKIKSSDKGSVVLILKIK